MCELIFFMKMTTESKNEFPKNIRTFICVICVSATASLQIYISAEADVSTQQLQHNNMHSHNA